jgi:hypothetical protein
MEALTLTTPISVASYTIQLLSLDWQNARINVFLVDQTGIHSNYQYDGAPATALMVSLNKANLTISSLQKRVLQQLVTDGKLSAGTVTGTPD